MKKKLKKIHKPYVKLQGFLVSNKLKQSDIANVLNIAESTVSLKINGQSDFYIHEMHKLYSVYSVPIDIFL